MKGYQTLFGEEAENYLYPFFWQHGEPQEILGEYIERIYQSGMKALCVEARPHPDFVGEQWWSDMDFILSELKKRDMKMWILDDSHFPTGYANGKIRDSYPEYLKLYINCRRYDIQGPLPQARIDLSLLKGRIWDKPETEIRIVGVYMARRGQEGPGDPIEEESLTDITPGMDPDTRLLTVDIPAGAYSIFAVYETGKGAEEATKDYLNPLVREATQVLIDEVYEPHFRHYREEFGRTILGFFSDEPRFGNAKGTECSIGTDMPLPWRRGLEKELDFELRNLPLLWTKGNGREAEIRFRYMDRITTLYHENFTDVLADWCETHGVWYLGHTIEDNGAHARLGYGTGHYFRGQQRMHAAGIDVIGTQIVPGMNYHHDAFSTGGSNGEFYHYALAKLASSAAHLDPVKEGRALCEAFGAYGWNEGLKTMKWIADCLMVRGINYIVPHAFNPGKFPDWDCPPHFYAHGHNPQYRYFPVLSGYMNRVMSLFRGGAYPARVGLFYPAETEWSGAYMPLEKPCRELTTHQISFDILSRDYLKRASVEEGYYRIHETAFEVLVFPSGQCLIRDLLPVLYEMLQKHIRIIFVGQLPEKAVGSCEEKKPEDFRTAGETAGEIGSQAQGGESVRTDRRKVREEIMWEQLRADSQVVALEELGDYLSPWQAVKLDHEQQELVVGEYVRDRKHFYMLFNESVSDTLQMRIRFRQRGHVYRYDAFADVLEQASSDLVCLTPYQSAIYLVSEDRLDASGMAAVRREGSYKTMPLPQRWTVAFADSFSYPDFREKVELHAPGFVHTVRGYENRSGTVRFSAEIQIPQAEQTVLDLGNVYETAEVFVNGISAGVRLCKPYVFDLTDYLMAGSNQLAIEITNTLGTEVRDALSHYLPIEPFGIEGPIRLLVK